MARLRQVTRARITQIMNLLNLSPEIQEEILFLPPILDGRDRLTEWQLRKIQQSFRMENAEGEMGEILNFSGENYGIV